MNFVNTTYLSVGMPSAPGLLTDIFSGSSVSSTATTQDESDAVLMAFRIMVCILGVIGNAMVIFVIIVLREHKKAVTHWYVLQLAIADSLFLLTLPFKVIEEAHGEWIFSGGMCKAKEAILFLNYYSSVLFLTVMSVDRYIAVCHALSARLQRLRTKFSAYMITAILWMSSLCLCAPVITHSDKSGIDPFCKCQYEFPKHTTTPEENCKNEGFSEGDALDRCLARQGSRCQKLNSLNEGFLRTNESSGDYDYDNPTYEYESDSGQSSGDPDFGETIYQMGCSYARTSTGWNAYILFNFIVMFAMPFLVMFVCYLLIALQLRKGQRRRSSVTNKGASISSAVGSGRSERKRSKSAASARADRNRIRVTCVCSVLVALFLVCWLPFHSVHLAKMKGIVGTTQFCHHLSAAASLVAYLNSALNPYVYNFVGTKFLTRLRSAAGSVRTSFKKRTSSVSSGGGTVRYKAAKRSSVGGTSSNSATVFTKIYKGKSDVETSHTPSNYDEDNQGEDNEL